MRRRDPALVISGERRVWRHAVNSEQKRRWNWAHDKQDNPGMAIRDATPLSDTAAFWRVISQVATIAMAVIIFGAFLYLAAALIIPVFAALVVALTFGPLIAKALPRAPPWVAAVLVVIVLGVLLYLAIISLSEPLAGLVARSGEIGNAVRNKLQILDTPMAALRDLASLMPGSGAATVSVAPSQASLITGAVSAVTPALAGLLLFFVTLFFFLIGRVNLRRAIINLASTHENRLRTLKIVNDIEHNLSAYLVTVTIINFSMGIVTIAATYAMGLPTPILWGALAFVLNYVPYLGPGAMYLILFAIGLFVFPTLPHALIPPAVQVVISFVEGQLITPNVVGRRMLLQPLAVFLSLAFWAWLWGPIGAFLATPILIIANVAINHLYPHDEHTLPG